MNKPGEFKASRGSRIVVFSSGGDFKGGIGLSFSFLFDPSLSAIFDGNKSGERFE